MKCRKKANNIVLSFRSFKNTEKLIIKNSKKALIQSSD